MKLSSVHKEGSIALLPSYAVPMTDDEVDGFIIAAKKKDRELGREIEAGAIIGQFYLDHRYVYRVVGLHCDRILHPDLWK
ncbi:MAG: hypothetical protein QMD22_10020 [archaeon]|nr:hypothetical protein [archaeon]